jgi:cytochrome c peroxidase
MRAHAFRQSVSAFAAACLAVCLATGAAAAQEADTDAPAAAELRELATGLFSPLPMNPPELPGNVLTRARIDLGTQLFFDPRLSRSWVFSCNSCHNIGMGGVDGLEVSIGHGWQTGPRNSPTVFNAVFNAAQFWDGRAADLAEQAMGPVQAGVEMASTPERVVETLTSMPGYIAAFEAAFPGQEDPVTFENMALAIEAFEATLITPNDRFDQFLQGDDNALDAAEKRGLLAFIEQGCAACHNGVNLGGQAYFPFGVVERPGGHVLPEGDRGRFQVTETADDYVFRASPLRNIALTAPYFHSGVTWDLEEAVAIMGVSQLGAELDEAAIGDITALLRTLSGEIPQVPFPVLPEIGPDTPRPDPM